jgi:hypothetical protein
MKQRTLIYTTSKRHWFKGEFEEIKKIQEQSRGLTAEVYDIKTITLNDLPTEKGADGKVRPSWVWFKKNLTEKAVALGYTQVVLHINKREKKKFGITATLGGTYQADPDRVIEFWMCADERAKARYYRGKSEFWRIFLHESAHGYERFLVGPVTQLVHHYDYVLHDIPGIYKLFDWTVWSTLSDTLTGLGGVKRALSEGKLLPMVERKMEALLDLCEQNGVAIKVTSTMRSCEAQNALYAQGRTTPGKIVTNAKCGESAHNFGVAFDICFNTATPYNGPWEKVGTLGESLGLEWGGRWTTFVDKPHFQLLFEYTLKDFKTGKVDYKKYI